MRMKIYIYPIVSLLLILCTSSQPNKSELKGVYKMEDFPGYIKFKFKSNNKFKTVSFLRSVIQNKNRTKDKGTWEIIEDENLDKIILNYGTWKDTLYIINDNTIRDKNGGEYLKL